MRSAARRAVRHLALWLLLWTAPARLSAADGEATTWRELNGQGMAAADAMSWGAAGMALRRALDLLEKEAPKAASAPDDDVRVAVVAANLAMVELAEGDVAEARRLFERALTIRRTAFGEDEPGIAALLNNLGELERSTGHPERARALHEKALAMRRALREPGHPEIAQSLNNLGVTLRDLGEIDEAGQLVGDALAIRRERLGPTHVATLESAANAAAIAIEKNDLAGAEALLRSTLEAVGSDTGRGASHDELVAYLRRSLVEVLLLQGQSDAAVGACEPMANGLATPDLATVCARAFARAGDPERARQLLEVQLERVAAEAEPAPEELLQLHWSLAEAAAGTGDLEKALAWIDQVIPPLEASNDRRLPLALNNRAYIAFELGRPLDAAADLRTAQGAIEAMAEPHDLDLERDILSNLASVLRALDLDDEAAAIEERLLETVPAAGPPAAGAAPTEPAPAEPAAVPPSGG